jgi:sugar/nucleoside kinase (ribokinase family)
MVDVYAVTGGKRRGRLSGQTRVRHVESDEMAALLASLNNAVYTAGGGAANAAKIAGLLGASAGFAGAVGAGPLGKGDEPASFFEAELRNAGLRLFLVPGKNPTGSCVILRDGPRDKPEQQTGRDIIACPGASLELSAGDIPGPLLKAAKVLLLDGYILTRPELSEALMNAARGSGVPVALDLGAVFIVRALGKKILEYLNEFPLLHFMNEEEARAFTEITGYTPEQLSGRGPFPLIVVNQGKQGATLFSEGRVITAETEARTPLESTGAGDAFCGAFLSAWVQKKPLAECAALANKAAGLVLAVPGTAVDEKLREQFAALQKAYGL